MAYYKYFSTPHTPWSPGATKDDSTLVDMDHFEGEETIETEKRDGENCLDENTVKNMI